MDTLQNQITAELLGLSLKLKSIPGKGTVISIDIPLSLQLPIEKSLSQPVTDIKNISGSGLAERNNDITSGSFSVGVELVNYTFTPLNVFDLTASLSILSINNDEDPVNPPFYNSHGLAVIINPLNNRAAAISYVYFNSGASGSVLAGDYLYF